MRQLPLGVRLRAEAVFESFWPGPNAEAVEALRAPATSGAAPIWLWGAAGVGKTHLLQAVCALEADAAYFPLDRALGLPPEAISGYGRSATLCIDDLDAIAGDASWERALFVLFNEAAELGHRLIFAAHAAPRQVRWAIEDWGSRAASSVIYQLREPTEADRLEALRLRAASRGLELPRETAEYLLRRMPRDLKTLLRILDDLDEASLVAQRRLTIPFIRAALESNAETGP